MMGKLHFRYAESVKTLQGKFVFDLYRCEMAKPYVSELFKGSKEIHIG